MKTVMYAADNICTMSPRPPTPSRPAGLRAARQAPAPPPFGACTRSASAEASQNQSARRLSAPRGEAKGHVVEKRYRQYMPLYNNAVQLSFSPEAL